MGSRVDAARPTNPSPKCGGLARNAVDEFFLHVISSPEQELFGYFVIFINRSAVGAA